MTWEDLLFAHWRVPAESVRRILPVSLEVDTFDGSAWIGIVPFLMTGVRARCLPPLPGVSSFPEVNVRTYVRAGGRAGVWFMSLDAADRLAVASGRRGFRLPYHHARMTSRRDHQGWTDYRSARRSTEADLELGYRPLPGAAVPLDDELGHFLTARDGMWVLDRGGRPRWGAIRHDAWVLHPAEAEIGHETLTRAAGVPVHGPPEDLRWSERAQVVAWRAVAAQGEADPTRPRPATERTNPPASA